MVSQKCVMNFYIHPVTVLKNIVSEIKKKKLIVADLVVSVIIAGRVTLLVTTTFSLF